MVSLRKANKEDAGFVAKMILMALHIDVPLQLPPQRGENSLMLKHITELVENCGTLYHWSRAVIAMEEETPVGMVLAYDGCDYHERRVRSFSFVCSDGMPVVDGDNSSLLSQPDESCRGEYYVDSLAVLPAYRGRGIGRMLLDKAVESGKSCGLVPTILVLPDNMPAVKLYESVGFRGKEKMTVFGDEYRKMRVIQIAQEAGGPMRKHEMLEAELSFIEQNTTNE